MILFIEDLDVNVGKFKSTFILRSGRRKRGLKYSEGLKGCKDVHHFNFDIGLQCFKYVFLFASHKPLQQDAIETLWDGFLIKGSL